VRYARLEMDGEEMYEIDLVNAKRVIGGTDQMASARTAMGF
jgi:P2 family phage contractile tail tube protein